MKRRVVLVCLLALATVLVLSTTASAKKPEAPHFETHAKGTFDSVGDPYDPTYGIPYPDGTGFTFVPGRIDVKVDVESVGEASPPYDDGSDWRPKWDYETEGFLKATIHLIDPDGNEVNRHVKLEVDNVTISAGYLRVHYFFECTYDGETYYCYIGQGSSMAHAYLPVLGAVLGTDNYPIVLASGGEDFSYDLNDPAVDPGP